MSLHKLRRRLLAILAADAAGYSRQVALDDRATVTALDEARAVFRSNVQVHAGRVVDTAGDSVLAVFESATAAVEAALAIQEQLAISRGSTASTILQFRIGLHLGDVLEQVDGTVYGDGVNVASRLQALATPGGIVVSQAMRNATQGRVKATFADLGRQTVKNIEEAIQTYALTPARASPSSTSRLRHDGDGVLSGRGTRVALAVSVICLLVGGFWLQARHDGVISHASDAASAQATPFKAPAVDAAAGPLSLVVLPFTNLTGDPAQEYVADGLTASITGDLSRIPDAFVVSAATARAFKSRITTARDVGKELGVRYVLQGTVQRSGTHLRIGAQLADSSTDAQLWSETFDGDSGDLFTLQDRVTTRLSTSMGRQLVVRAARESERHRGSATVADLLLRARAVELRPWNLANFQETEILYRKVMELEPDNVPALSGLAAALLLQIPWFEHSASAGETRLAEARVLALRARTLDPEHPLTYHALALVFAELGDWDEAVRNSKAQVALEPKSQAALSTLGYMQFWSKQPQAALLTLHQGVALDPKFPTDAMLYNLARVELMLGHYPTAIEWAVKAAARNPDLGFREPTLTVAYKLKGDDAKALSTAAAAIKADPGFTVSYVVEDVKLTRLADYYQTTIVPAMRWAGFPE